MAIDDKDRDFGDFSGGFGVSRDFGATRDSNVGRADGSQGFSGNDGRSFSFDDSAFAGRNFGLDFGGAQPSAGPTGVQTATAAAAPAFALGPAPAAAPDSLGRKLREGRIGDISVSPASILGGLAGMVVGGPIGAALGARGGQALGDSIGLDQDVTLGDLFGDFDIGFSGDGDGGDGDGGPRPASQPAVDTRSGRNDGYVSISDRVQAAPPAGPVAPAAPAPEPAIPAGVNPALIYGPYFDHATGQFQGTGPYADLVRGYGVNG